jgi:hypothetical protein
MAGGISPGLATLLHLVIDHHAHHIVYVFLHHHNSLSDETHVGKLFKLPFVVSSILSVTAVEIK